MPIKSYLIHAHDGQKDQLVERLSEFENCEINPSTNEDVVVLVTDTPSVEKEKELAGKLETIKEIKNMALVSGFDI